MGARITGELAREIAASIDQDGAGTHRTEGKARKAVISSDERRRRFLAICEAERLPVPIAEYRFAPPRRWRFDFAWLQERIALEVQGGIWTGGRHVRGAGLLKEHEKLNAAVLGGWGVMFCTPQQVDDESIFDLLRAALTIRANRGSNNGQ